MASQAPIRRNDPCPCGSGRRYKECHGSLAPQAGLDALVRRALTAHQQGRIAEAEADYRAILAAHPGHPVATHYLGLATWQKGDPEGAERLMRAALEADASIADFHNNLGLLLRDTGRAEEAVACFRRALEVDPGYAGARSNLGLALESAGRVAEAVEAWRAALASHPADATMRQNLARALLTLGRFDEGWPEYRWRLLAQGLARTAPDRSAKPLGRNLAGRQLALLAEQGLGDILFFLRFAPELAARGARLAFVGDARLHGLLSRTGLFALGMHAPGPVPPACEPTAIGDLPWLLEAGDPARFPPPLPLAPLEDRVAAMRERIESLGPGPRIALTWRSGVASVGPARTQVKQVGIEALGAALRGVRATWIGVQRLPGESERERLAQAIGAPVHDFSAANDDLESMLALLRVVDRYVGVSNTNTHLGASVGTSLDVLVAHPPEWRWTLGAPSPWYPQARLYRERPGGDWRAALAQLAAALRAA
jgi:tetratricopeptide (TPR) repeat protein